MNPAASNTAAARSMPAMAFALPVLAIVVMRFMFGPAAGPDTSAAAVTPPAPAPAATADQPIARATPESLKAAKWVQRIDRAAPLRSPMDHAPKTAAAPAPTHTPRVDPVQPAGPAAPRGDVTLGAILNSPRGALATVGGRVVRQGDEIEPGWTIKSIDPAAQTVVLQGPAGEVMELKGQRRVRSED